MKIGRYTVTLSNTDKLLLGSYTKGALIEYYEYIAPKMVPYLKNHPLMMHRFPDGLKGESFYQKNIDDYFPHWIKNVRIEKKGGHYNAVLAQNKATLIYLANQACITPHLWLSRYDNLTFPDRIIFDLDPSVNDFTLVRTVALAIKKHLDSLGLISFVMTSGSRGLHIYLPIRRTIDFNTSKAFAQHLAERVITDYPHLATLEIRKENRDKKVFIDILRNQRGATAVAPYSVRAKENAPIAMPINWSHVTEPTLHPQQFTIENIFDHLLPDPWEQFFTVKQSLTKELLSNILPV